MKQRQALPMMRVLLIGEILSKRVRRYSLMIVESMTMMMEREYRFSILKIQMSLMMIVL